MQRKTLIVALFCLASLITISASTQNVTPPIVPDPGKTPGDTLDVTKADICVPGYAKKVRNVPESVKRQAYEEYGIMSHKAGEYEVDHLISLELGGSNSLRNLWPQSYITRPYNARVKDKLENALHAKVCSGELDLKEAQHAIAADWISAYRRYVGTDIPLLTGGNPPTGASISGQIIGNNRSKVYHVPGCPGYNRVSAVNQVTFKTAEDAEAAGYRKAKNCP